MTKALQAAEIIKTRLPFLHQENKLLSYQATHKVEGEEGKPGRERNVIRTGIAITLSRNAFEIQDTACYQKPKPRQFVQPAPRGQGKKEVGGKGDRDRQPEPAKEDLRKRKNSRNRRNRNKKASRSASAEEHKARSLEKQAAVWGGSKK